ncbi:DNA topoisomerase, type IA, central domain protein [Metallosphaera sedula]|uniref:DNA topoisomerase n=2 Tax=Metallosphaera sedula TaxID=43687 RepID=A4YF11_METS5|nr:type IA DNA topoisomerase [Metallosphaera sedula]ABP95013.1 DNA topoisomerase, type IA, central domain protein [Metallosphaera sedula DSM 5348]AIM26999.1 DNA topoisomerase, type IA, central domain protein [Metallosphaera sedula]AKV73919.1 DNA topoisomerase [Metallosphaera sedula]AKV76160.1 DNA topoisomerase [Metallosphaera sedula]AKV78412.1 DNA topoisomerase [Metallosphaera sedula]
MKLVITEKPSVALDIARALGKPTRRQGYLEVGEYLVTWTYGHLLEIGEIAPKRWNLKDLPIFPEKFEYDLIKGKESQFKVVRKLLEGADAVINCGDAGREGELIVRELLEFTGYRGKVLRLWTSEALTRDVVLRELRRLRPSSEFDSLYYSALARQNGDWIVGINLTRLVTLKAGGGEVWSVGRVQTPTLAMIVKRDREIEAFKPEIYYVVLAGFEGEMKGVMLRNGEEARLAREEAEQVVNALKSVRSGRVEKVDVERREERPPLLHSLTSLQREANTLYGLSAKRTLDVAQSLYEEWKLISYPRTDARYLGEGNRDLVKDVLRKLGRGELVPRVDRVGKRVFDSSKLTDHHAIIPLDRPPENLPAIHRKVYDLVYRKFVGAFMDDYVYELQRVFIRLDGELFLVEGKRNLQLGWMELYPHEDNPLKIPSGEVRKEWVKAEERQTKPPARFTEASLLREMERLGLGTPATRAGIIETLLERGYVERRGKSLYSTDKGRELVDKLGDSKVVSPDMTAEWERQLEEIYVKRLGEKGYQEFMEGIRRFTREEVERLMKREFKVERRATPEMLRLARAVSRDLGVKLEGTGMEEVKRFLDENLPKMRITCKCGGEVVGFSRGWKCRKCGTVVWREIAGKKITFRQAKSLFQGKELKMKGFRSRTGKRFSATVYLEDGKVKFKFE